MAVTGPAQLRERRGEYGLDGLLAGIVGMTVVGLALPVVGLLLLHAGHGRSAAGALCGAAAPDVEHPLVSREAQLLDQLGPDGELSPSRRMQRDARG